MRAIVQDAYGSADVLRIAEIDRPAIAATEVLVKVRAAGMDRDSQSASAWNLFERPARWGVVAMALMEVMAWRNGTRMPKALCRFFEIQGDD
jgi:hypothetical protein